MAHHRVHLSHNKRTKKTKDPLDKIVYFFAFAAPIFELPQLYTIYSEHSAKNVSLITWGFFSLASFIWLLYAIRHKLKPVVISYFLFFVIESMTFGGILHYR